MLAGVRFEGATSRYTDTAVHRRTVVLVRDQDEVLRELRLFGSSIERAGAWKVFSHVTDRAWARPRELASFVTIARLEGVWDDGAGRRGSRFDVGPAQRPGHEAVADARAVLAGLDEGGFSQDTLPLMTEHTTSHALAPGATIASPPRRLDVFERYLSLWVGLCMLAGVVLGKTVPALTDALRGLEFGSGSQINAPIAVLIWLMITPMMMKVDFGAIRNVGRRPRGLVITLIINWLVKPFSMAAIAWLFFRLLFSPWIGPADADQYIAGCIILAAAPCTAMVFVWSYLSDGDPAYTLVQVSVNDLIMLVLFAPIVRFLVSGASSLSRLRLPGTRGCRKESPAC